MYYLINEKNNLLIADRDYIYHVIPKEKNLEDALLTSLCVLIKSNIKEFYFENFHIFNNTIEKAFLKSKFFLDYKDPENKYFNKNINFMLIDYFSTPINLGMKKFNDLLSFILSSFKKIQINNKELIQEDITKSTIVDLNEYIKLQFKKSKIRTKLGEFNLFCDGSLKENVKQTKIGGYISTNKKILKTYSEKIDYYTCKDVNELEMYSIFYGLSLACEMGIKNINIFTDSLVSVEKITHYLKGKETNPKYVEILGKIKNKFNLIENYKIHHITRNLNLYADQLTH